MKIFRLIAVTMFIAVISASANLAQTAGATQPSASLKIAVVETQAFADEKVGIKAYVSALKKIEAEFAPRITELQGMATKLNNLQKEIQTLSQAAQADVRSVDAKREEYERIATDAKRKQEDLQSAIERRRAEVLGPVTRDVGTALQEYAKQKGFDILLDVSQDERNLILAVSEKANITLDFINSYNARPATATPARAAAATTRP